MTTTDILPLRSKTGFNEDVFKRRTVSSEWGDILKFKPFCVIRVVRPSLFEGRLCTSNPECRRAKICSPKA